MRLVVAARPKGAHRTPATLERLTLHRVDLRLPRLCESRGCGGAVVCDDRAASQETSVADLKQKMQVDGKTGNIMKARLMTLIGMLDTH